MTWPPHEATAALATPMIYATASILHAVSTICELVFSFFF